MEFKVFMQAVEEQIDKFQSESELKEWLKNYARTIGEENRKEFLKYFEKRGKVSHEEELKAVIDWCEEINEAELTLSCSGYEKYGESYWDSDWVYEYEDNCGIGKQIEAFYQLAEQCVYDKDYKTASIMYDELGTINVLADDETGGDPVEMEIESLEEEGLVNLDLKRIAGLTLYAVYQSTEMEKRAEKLYNYFSWSMFKDFKLEEMFAAGSEPLKELDTFMEHWIAYLRGQEDRYTSRLLIEAVLYRYGEDGLLEEAKRNANRHPRLMIEMLEKYYDSGLWDKLYREGMDALNRMERSMKIRGKAALLAAAGVRELGKVEGIKAAYKEAFYSESSPANYLRTITCEGYTAEENQEMLEHVEKVLQDSEKMQEGKEARYYWQVPRDTDSYELGRYQYLTIQFLAGKFDLILQECQKQKTALGWSGQYISEGVPLLLLLLFKEEMYPPAMKNILRSIRSDVGYKNEYNEPELEEVILRWRQMEKSALDKNMERKIFEYLQHIIDERVAAIVSGGHRGSYYKAALLAAALGEVERSMGIPRGKEQRIEKYLSAFPRHRAFKEEMQAYRG